MTQVDHFYLYCLLCISKLLYRKVIYLVILFWSHADTIQYNMTNCFTYIPTIDTPSTPDNLTFDFTLPHTNLYC